MAETAAPIVVEANSLDAIEGQVRSLGTDPDALSNAAINAMRALIMGNDADANAARQNAAQALATARGIPHERAKQQVTQMEQQYNQAVERAKQQATEAPETTAAMVSTGALLAFVSLVLGAITGWFGARSGVVHPVFTDRIIPTRHVL